MSSRHLDSRLVSERRLVLARRPVRGGKIPFVLGRALYMKAIHGGKSKNTHHQQNLPAPVARLAYAANHVGVAEAFADPPAKSLARAAGRSGACTSSGPIPKRRRFS